MSNVNNNNNNKLMLYISVFINDVQYFGHWIYYMYSFYY